MVNPESELDAVKQEIGELKRKIDKVEARVEELEGKAVRNDEEKDELKQKRNIYDRLLSNLDKLLAEKARLEERQHQPREAAGIFRD